MRSIIILLFLIPIKSFADYGFIYEGDLNSDGVNDYIYSGPSSLFGNGGGPCLIKISIAENEYNQKVVHCGNRVGLTLDLGNQYRPARIYGYSHFGAGVGSLYTITLDGKFTESSIPLYPSVDGSPDNIDALILKTIKSNGQLIKFEQIKSNYLPPKLSCGRTWEEGC